MLSRLILLTSLSLLLAGPAAAQRMYKCKDAQGNTYYTEIPPAACLGRETDVLDKSGVVVRKNEPTKALTPEQEAAREAAAKKKAEADEKAMEDRRKNMALLNTYASEKDIDEARARALDETQAAIVETQKRIEGAQARQKDLAAEKEFYVKKPMPAKLRQDISNNDIEIKTQTELLDAKKKQIGVINAKYDDDKQRYILLTKGK
jgi:Domain of unknown function (DUF4124)